MPYSRRSENTNSFTAVYQVLEADVHDSSPHVAVDSQEHPANTTYRGKDVLRKKYSETMRDAALSESHARMLLEDSTISPDVVAERGYETITRREDLTEYPDWQRRLGLYVPNYSPDDVTVQSQLRPNKPRKGGPKYESPQGSKVIFDVHPKMRDEARYGTGELDVTEGIKTGDSNTSRGRPTIVLNGVWGWKVAKTYDELLPCWDYVNLDRRPVNIIFDGDVMTKREVQQALDRFVPALEARGADVRVTYLPDEMGLDDYYAAGHTLAERQLLSRRYEPADISEIRLSGDIKLKAAIDVAWASWYAFDWSRLVGTGDRPHWMRGHSACDVEKVAIDEATKSGVLVEDGIYFSLNARSWAEQARTRKATVLSSIDHLEAEGRIRREKPPEEARAAGYVLLTARASPYQIESKSSGERGEGLYRVAFDPTGTDLRAPSAPRLRWSAPKFTRNPEGGWEREYIRRLGKHNGRLLDHLERAGGSLELSELAEIANKRARDLRRRNLPLLQERGIVELDGDTVSVISNWLGALIEERRISGEIDADLKAESDHKRQREAYRNRDKTPVGTRHLAAAETVDPVTGEVRQVVVDDGFVAGGDVTEADMDAARAKRERRYEAERERPVSPLAEAMRAYLERNPHHADEPAGWIGSTLWAYSLYDGKPTPQESKAALAEIGGDGFLERLTRGAVA